MHTDRTEQVRQTTIFRIPLTFFKLFWATKNRPTKKRPGAPVNSSTPQLETTWSGPLLRRFTWLISIACKAVVFLGAGGSCLLCLCCLFVMPWLPSLVWCCCWERLQIGRAASLGIDRLGRKQKIRSKWRPTPVYFFIIQHGVMLAERHNAYSKENA